MLFRSVTEGPGSDHDGVVEPGEQAEIDETVLNPTKVDATDVSAILSTTVAGASVQQPSPDFTDTISAGAPGTNLSPFVVTLPATAPCGSRVDFRLDLATAQEPEIVPVLVGVGCNGTFGTTPGPAPSPARPAAPAPVRPRASLAVDRRADRKSVV